MLRRLFLVCYIFLPPVSAEGGDGLALFWTPDFPNFSFEYDPELWTVERHDQEDDWYIVASHILTDSKLVFRFSPKLGNGLDYLFTFYPKDVLSVSDRAFRMPTFVKGLYSYKPSSTITFCELEVDVCQARLESYGMEWKVGTYAVGELRHFETVVSDAFYRQMHLTYPEANYLARWHKDVWLSIRTESFAESFILDADTVVKNMNF